MSSASPKRITESWGFRTLGLRLVLGYALLFAVSTLLLSVLAFVLFRQYMSEPDRAFVEAQAHILQEAYLRGGLQEVRLELSGSPLNNDREELLVRIADLQGRTVFLYNPDDWRRPELAELEQQPVPATSAWVRMGPAEDEDALGAYAIRLPGGVLQVGKDSDVREDVLESMREVFLAIALPIVLLALLGGAIMAYRALQPVRQLLTTLEEIVDTGDVHKRAPVAGVRGEFAELVNVFNRMLDRIQMLVVGMRQTLDDAAHDLRTPLTHLRGRAELALQQERSSPEYREALSDCLEASETVVTMLNTLMEVSEAEAGAMVLRLEDVQIAPLIESVADPYRFVAEQKAIQLYLDVPAGLHVSGDAARLRQVIANLLDNAIKYTPSGGRVAVTARQEADVCSISVEDTGQGIREEEFPRIWGRLYRGDASRSERGIGLGLSLVKAITEAHGGRVEVKSTLGAGSTFTVYLPR